MPCRCDDEPTPEWYAKSAEAQLCTARTVIYRMSEVARAARIVWPDDLAAHIRSQLNILANHKRVELEKDIRELEAELAKRGDDAKRAEIASRIERLRRLTDEEILRGDTL